MTSTERLLESFGAPLPPDGLRARSLAAARAAMVGPAGQPDLWTRLWHSRIARLAWATAVAALVLAHVVLSVPARSAPARPRSPLVLAGNPQDPELASTVALPRLRSVRLPQLDVTTKSEPAHSAGEITPRRDRHDA